MQPLSCLRPYCFWRRRPWIGLGSGRASLEIDDFRTDGLVRTAQRELRRLLLLQVLWEHWPDEDGQTLVRIQCRHGMFAQCAAV